MTKRLKATNCCKFVKKYDLRTLMPVEVKYFHFWVLLGVFLLILQIPVFAQRSLNGSIPQALAGGSSLGSIENVNLYNGKLSVNIPLLQIGGRGASGYSISAPINNGIWYINPTEMPFGSMNVPMFSNSWGSLSPDYSPGKMEIRGTYDPCQNGIGITRLLTRIYFQTTDGTEYEFVDKQSDGEPIWTPCTNNGTIRNNRGKVFVTKNGSSMTFVSDTDITEGFIPGSGPYGLNGYLIFKSGTRYRISEGQVDWIQDRNGNRTTFDRSITNKLIITDSLKRKTIITYNILENQIYHNKIEFLGIGGVTQTIKIYRNTLSQALAPGETLKQFYELFSGTVGGWTYGYHNPHLITKIELPDQRSYQFLYNSFGELARISFPTGGAIEYSYGPGVANADASGLVDLGWNNENPDAPFRIQGIYRRLWERREYANGETGNNFNLKTYYSHGQDLCSVDSGSTDVSNYVLNDLNEEILASKQIHYFYGAPCSTLDRSGVDYPAWKDGQEYRTDYFAGDGTTLLQRVLRKSENKAVPWASNQTFAPLNDPRPTTEVVISVENEQALAILTKTEYDENGSSDPAHFSHLNVKRSKAYNYKLLDLNTAQTADLETIAAMYNESDLISVSEADYLYNEGYKSRNILGLLSETRVLNPQNQTEILAKSQILYDETGQIYSMLDEGPTEGYEAPTGTYASLRGNATTLKTWKEDTNTWIETHTQYDNFGNVRKQWDSSGDPSRFIENKYTSQDYFVYPIRTIAPAPDPTGLRGTTESSISSRSYDFWTGRVLTVTDTNNQTTSFEYDHLLRLKKVTPPAGGAISEKEYGDTLGNFFVKTRTQVDAVNWAESTAFLDNLGRIYKTQTKDAAGDIFGEVKYDDLGRIERVSNPYRQGEQILWSKPRYDNAGRVVETYAPAPQGQTGASLGIVEYGIFTIPGLIGNYTEATDASGRKARSLTNVFGQVVRVDEPTGDNDLGPLNNPNQPSYYTYNVKGELIKIQQGQQNRYFMYDSLGRLIRVKQPEQIPNANLATTGNPENNQWTAGYTYDVFGNVITTTDAKGTVITNDYDNVGRLIKTTYTDGTPQADYYYDGKGLGLPQAPQFSKGQLTRVSNGISETKYTSFDNYGRVLTSEQFTDGKVYPFQYKYDSVGNLIEETYPSLRVVKTHLDADGGLAAVSSKTANSPYKTYASNFNYTATGAVKAMMLGNGRWETAEFNSRQQLTQNGLGNSATDSSLWKINYDYGELNANGSVDADKNIGSIAKQTITLPTATFVQTYKYDALNRLVEAKENAGTVSGTENWKQTFQYDRYGNRTNRYQKVGGTILTIDNKTLPQVDPTTNRFTTAQGYIYDFNGNLIQDAENRGFTYDGNDKQTVVRDLTIPTTQSNPDANVVGRYYYDGEGKRVKKVTSLETTIFVYAAGGNLVAEYSTQITTTPTTSYLTTDHLGSPRVITDKQGNVISRRDFMPFGEEILAGVGGRDTQNLKYSASGIDNVRQRFTGYEKDIETELDFAEARMYQNKHGRFTAPDPLIASASLEDPQTFNRYVYVGNDPVNLTDPSGLKWCKSNTSGTYQNNFTTCTGEWGDVEDGKQIPVGENNMNVPTGSVIALNDDDTYTIITTPKNYAEQQGLQVQAESEHMFDLGYASPDYIGKVIQNRRLEDSLPRISGPDPDDNLGRDLLENMSLLPVAGTPADITLALIDFSEGDNTGALTNILGIIPYGDVAKIGKKLKKLSKYGNDLPPNKLNVRIDDDRGLVAKWREVSGGMTDEEKALRFPKGQQASHTEARALKFPALKRGQRVTMTGLYKPCTICQGKMNDAAADFGISITYRYRKGGKTIYWRADPNKSIKRRRRSK